MKCIVQYGIQYFIKLISIIAITFSIAQADSFTIKGIVKNIPDQKVLLKVLQADGANYQVSLIAGIVDGKFEFNGKLKNPPVVFRVGFEKEEFKCRGFFIADNSSISLALSAGEPITQGHNVTIDKVEGSVSHDAYTQLNNDLQQRFDSRITKLYNGLNLRKSREEWNVEDIKKMEEVQAMKAVIEAEKTEYLKKLAKSHSSHLIGLFAVSKLGRQYHFFENGKEQAELFAGLSEPLKESRFAADYSAVIARKTQRQRLETEVSVGKVFKDFSQSDVAGKTVKMSDLLQPGRYVLLDFWASWCGPCRDEKPHILAAYKKYYHKGFNVLSVSLDDDRDSWLQAIEKDSMPWIHVSDLKGWDNVASNLYAVNAIPMNFLFDGQGTIVATNLRGEALENKLAELLGQ